jgi:hypothetical protein
MFRFYRVPAGGEVFRARLGGVETAAKAATSDRCAQNAYEVRPRKDHRGVNLISDALPFGPLWYGEPNAISNAVDYAKFRSRSHRAVIRVYDGAGNVIGRHEHAGQFSEW